LDPRAREVIKEFLDPRAKGDLPDLLVSLVPLVFMVLSVQSAVLVLKERLDQSAKRDLVVQRETRATEVFVDLKGFVARRVSLVLVVLVVTRETKVSVVLSESPVPVVFPECKESLATLVQWGLVGPVVSLENKELLVQVESLAPAVRVVQLAPRVLVELLVKSARLVSQARRDLLVIKVPVVNKVFRGWKARRVQMELLELLDLRVLREKRVSPALLVPLVVRVNVDLKDLLELECLDLPAPPESVVCLVLRDLLVVTAPLVPTAFKELLERSVKMARLAGMVKLAHLALMAKLVLMAGRVCRETAASLSSKST